MCAEDHDVPPEAAEGACPAAADPGEFGRKTSDTASSVLSVQSFVSQLGGAVSAVYVGGYCKIIVFTCNIVFGLVLSQVLAGVLPSSAYDVWCEMVRLPTLWCLSFVMINVGYEFTIDKARVRSYGVDFFIAMTAAGFPWLMVAAYFIWALPEPMPWQESLLAARFAAPTSAGILFCMLEAARLKETWLFQKARILAIFDDLDTIVLMVPLKALIMGVKWELFLVLAVIAVLLALAYVRLHTYKLPSGWGWTMLYALGVVVVTEVIYIVTKNHIAMEAVHLEVLLPAFTIGAVIKGSDGDEEAGAEAREAEAPDDGPQDIDAAAAAAIAAAAAAEARGLQRRRAKEANDRVATVVSACFMVLVGLSMPPLLGGDSADEESLDGAALLGHVAAVTLLMVLGKMFPIFCYTKEANLRTRFALCLGMCPRGEVGAGVIVISLSLGIKGLGTAISIISLALNITMSGLYILSVKKLVTVPANGDRKLIIDRQTSHLWNQPPRDTAEPGLIYAI